MIEKPHRQQTGNKSLTESHYLGPSLMLVAVIPLHFISGFKRSCEGGVKNSSAPWLTAQPKFNEFFIVGVWSFGARDEIFWPVALEMQFLFGSLITGQKVKEENKRRHSKIGHPSLVIPRVGKPFVDWFDGKWPNKVDWYDDDVPGGFVLERIKGSVALVFLSLSIAIRLSLTVGWLSPCRPSRTQCGPSEPDNQIISRIKNGDRS